MIHSSWGHAAHRGEPCVAVVIPCYRVRRHIANVLRRIGPEVSRIYCVDDACPEHSGEAAREAAQGDPRFRLLVHEQNQGVGGAVCTGYRQALADGADILVKLDGDDQMDPARIPELIAPLVHGEADYTKGNRFFDLEGLRGMPTARLIGNAGLSFLTKLSSGYWKLFDPTNGYTAIHATAARALPLDKLARRYFFESDILFRLNTWGAVVVDVPIPARYGDEKSNLSILKTLRDFPRYHLRNLAKRLVYNYYLRDFSMASLHLLVGAGLLAFGTLFGAAKWIEGFYTGELASAGTVMLAGMPVILGVQFLLSFINLDIANVPRDPLQKRLRHARHDPGQLHLVDPDEQLPRAA